MSHKTSHISDHWMTGSGRRPLSQLAVLGLAALLAAVMAWAGGDPWKDKTSDQWDAKDCQKIMSNSPWAQIVETDATWRTPTAGTTQDLSRGPTDKAVGTTAGPGATGVEGRPGYAGQEAGGGAGNSPGGGGATAKCLIRWASSDVERQAVARNAILSGKMKEDDAKKYLSAKSAEYQLLILGPDMTPFNSLNENALMAAASIRPRKMKESIAPTKVQIERDPNSKRVVAVLFFFPKQTSGGEPVVTADEKGVDFVCKLGTTAVKASFDVKHMVGKQGQDL